MSHLKVPLPHEGDGCLHIEGERSPRRVGMQYKGPVPVSGFHASPVRICYDDETPAFHPLFYPRGRQSGSGHRHRVSPREQIYSSWSKFDGSSRTARKDPALHCRQKLMVYSTLSQDSIEGPIIVGLAIGISSPCTTSQPCQPPSKSVGDELYAGPYNPVLRQPGKFYQNFTIQIPAVVSKGKAQLNVVLFGLFGVSFFCQS